MNKTYIRFFMFLGALILSVGIPLIWEVSRNCWMAIPFLVVAEGLVLLSASDWKAKSFPLHLPLQFFVYPLYFAATLTLVLVSAILSWKILLTLELIALFLVLMSIGICLQITKSKEN